MIIPKGLAHSYLIHEFELKNKETRNFPSHFLAKNKNVCCE